MLVVNVFDALDRVFHDTALTLDKRAMKIHLFGFRGGRVSFQLACQNMTQDIKFKVSSFVQGKTPIDFPLQIHRLVYVRVEANTSWERNLDPPDQRGENPPQPFVDEQLDPRMKPYVVKAAPFYTAEAMLPFSFSNPEKNRPTVFYFSFTIEKGFSHGLYTGTVKVSSGRETIDIPVEIMVGQMIVPSRQTLNVTNWFSLDNIGKYHGLKMWTPNYWSMLRRYARLMRTYGQNVFWVPQEVFLEWNKDRKPHFNWTRFDRYVNLFLQEGFDLIEGTHLAVRKSQKTLGTYVLPGTTTDISSVEGQEVLHSIVSALWQHLKAKKWEARYVQHVADEPTEPEVGEYHRVANLIRKSMPGVRLIDAILCHKVMGAVDIHVPILFEFDETYTFDNFRKLAREGGEFWFYTCCGPRGSYLNRFLDFSLLRTRLLHWVNFLEGATGYLHWGLNMYQEGQDPFESSVGQTAGDNPVKLPPGDTHIVYPGPDGPCAALRFEAMRDGIVDYELLCALAAKAGQRYNAGKIIKSIIRSPSNYVNDIPGFRQRYKKLLE